MGRFFRWLKSLFNRGMEKLEDPAMMLDQARRDMQEALVANREKAVQAITQKNRLQGMVEEAERKSDLIEQHAIAALKQGNRDLAKELMIEKANNEQTLISLRSTLDQSIKTVETVKKAIKHQENEVRKKAAEALAIKAQWKQAQIQNSISKALEGLTFETQFESVGNITDKIRDVQSEAVARQEMMESDVKGKIIEVQSSTADMAAEEELTKLEEKMGLKPKTDVQSLSQETNTNTDTQLSDLEKRLKQDEEQ